MWLGVVTLFPEMLLALDYGVTGRAIQNNLLQLSTWSPRHYTLDKQGRVDDRPYGGGPGMVMQVQPLQDAVLAAKAVAPSLPKVVYLSPQGQRLTQQAVEKFAIEKALLLVAGRYEGVDERFIKLAVDEEWSLGDYVLSGGELAAMVVIDAIARLLPGALGHAESAQQDSFAHGLLDCPHYTRPEVVAGLAVPPVLLSGDHQAIAQWRHQQALGKTWLKRPDLLQNYVLADKERTLLAEFIAEQGLTEQSLKRNSTDEDSNNE